MSRVLLRGLSHLLMFLAAWGRLPWRGLRRVADLSVLCWVPVGVPSRGFPGFRPSALRPDGIIYLIAGLCVWA